MANADEATRSAVLAALDDHTPDNVRKRAREVAGLFSENATAPGLAVGDSLGPYVLTKVLGSGGQATVYLAKHQQLERQVAIKVPHSEISDRLLREARMLAKLKHAHIVGVEHIELSGGVPYMVMEYCEGGTLADRLDAFPDGLPLDLVRVISIAVLRALSAAHATGVIHRDIKPSNVLFSEGGTVKVCDFGIGSVALGSELDGSLFSHATRFAGTPLYMAPEQADASLREDGSLDGRADLYAFGKLLFVMLTGRAPRMFRPASMVRKGLALSWDALILKLTEERPQDRYASSMDVLSALGAVTSEVGEAGEVPPAVSTMAVGGDQLPQITPAVILKAFLGFYLVVAGSFLFAGFLGSSRGVSLETGIYLPVGGALALGALAAFAWSVSVVQSKTPSMGVVVCVQLALPALLASIAWGVSSLACLGSEAPQAILMATTYTGLFSAIVLIGVARYHGRPQEAKGARIQP